MSFAYIELEGIQELLLQHADEPQKLLNCAKEGSFVSLHALVSSMQSGAFPSRLLPKAVDLLASILRQHRKRPFEFDVVPVCVAGLATLEDGFFDGRKVLSQKVMHCWPMVRDWIEHAGNVVLAGKRCNGQLLEAIEHGLRAFSSGRVTEEDGILTLTTRIWLSYVGSNSFSRELARPAFAVVSLEAIRSSALSKTTIPLLDRIYGKSIALGGSVESLVDVLMRRLRTEPRMADLEERTLLKTLDGVHHLLKSLLILPSAAQDGALTMFLERGGIRRLLCMLRNIISNLESSSSTDSLALKSASTFSMGLWVITYLFCCSPGISSIHQSIKHGLFGVLLSAMPHLHRLRRAPYSGQEAIELLLSQALPQAFTFRSVVVASHRYLRKWMEKCGPVCRGCGLPHSLADTEMYDAWDKLFCKLRHQVSAYRFFSKCLKERIERCDNPSCLCDATNQSPSIRKCAGCKTALFCSTHCQRVAWQAHNHKAECAQTQQQLASSGLSANDARFLALVAHEEVRQSLHDVIFHSKCREDQRIQREFSPSSRGFTIDYTKLKTDVHQFAFESRPDLNPFLSLPTVVTMGKTTSSKSAEDEHDHSTGFGDVKPDETLQTTLEIIYPFGSEKRTLYVSAEFSGLAYHGYECTCCRYHGDDRHGEDESTCSTHKEVS